MAAASRKSSKVVQMKRKSTGKVHSIQGEPRRNRSQRSRISQLNDKCLANAHRHGMKWEDNEVEVLVNLIDKDSTTYDMAMKLGRSYYSAQVARSHVGFAMRHENAIFRAKARLQKGKK